MKNGKHLLGIAAVAWVLFIVIDSLAGALAGPVSAGRKNPLRAVLRSVLFVKSLALFLLLLLNVFGFLSIAGREEKK